VRISIPDTKERGDPMFDKAMPSKASDQVRRDCFHVREPHHEYDQDVRQKTSIQGGIDFAGALRWFHRSPEVLDVHFQSAPQKAADFPMLARCRMYFERQLAERLRFPLGIGRDLTQQ